MNICFGALRSVLLQALQEQTKQAAAGKKEAKEKSGPILEAPDAGVKRYHDDICGGDRSAALESMITTEGYATSDSVTQMIASLKLACDNDDHQMSI